MSCLLNSTFQALPDDTLQQLYGVAVLEERLSGTNSCCILQLQLHRAKERVLPVGR